MTAAALPVLVGLGVWQLQRAEWKAGVLADLAANAGKPATTIQPGDAPERFQFRRVVLDLGCDPPPPIVKAGRNLRGHAGYVVLVRCQWSDPADDGEGTLLLNIGWGSRPDSWKGVASTWPLNRVHRVEGVLVKRGGDPGWMLVATSAPPPLQASAPPSLDSISNNHMSYAIQWFSFAAIAASIYAAFVVRWRRGG